MGCPIELPLCRGDVQRWCIAGGNDRRRHSKRPPPSSLSPRPLRHFHFLPLIPSTAASISLAPSTCHRRADASPSTTRHSPSVSFDGDPSYFVKMLSLDNNPLVREQAIIQLWIYVAGGKQYVDSVMRCCGLLNTILSHLHSEPSSTCEAAAGILRMISDVNEYKNIIVESGAIEIITDLLSHSYFTSEGKEQCLSVLWNLSVCDNFNSKTGSKLLLLLVDLLDDEDMKVKEATARVVAIIVFSEPNQSILISAGMITKLANMVNIKSKECKRLRKEAKKALSEFSKDECYRILVLEEGLVLVPVIGAAAYKSFKPTLHSWPSLPDGTIFEQKANMSSDYGASSLLLGLNIDDGDINLEEMKIKAMDGRARQQFLVRAEAIETDEVDDYNLERPIKQRYALLPWVDGVARLVLILGLQDLSAVARAADSIADASVNEHMRVAFKEAGAVNHLVCLLNHQDSTVQFAAICAMERLSVSDYVCDAIAKDSLHNLINALIHPHLPEFLKEKVLDVVYRIFESRKRPLLSKFSEAVFQSNCKSDYVDIPIKAALSDGLDRRSGVEWDLIVPLISILKTCSPTFQWKAVSILESLLGIAFPGMVEEFISADIESALTVVFQQNVLEGDVEMLKLVEESGLAISASSSLLKELLKYDVFLSSVNLSNLAFLLHKSMASHILPLRHKHLISASLLYLSPHLPLELRCFNPENAEATTPLHSVVALIEKLKVSDPDAQKGLMREVNRIISKADVDGIREVVKLVEGDEDTGSISALEILHGLSLDRGNHLAMGSAGGVPAIRRYLFCGKEKKPEGRMLALLILKNLLE